MEIDREFVQFFHRRVAWLALREFDRAVADADHTLALMDFSSLHAPDVRLGGNARAIPAVRAVSSHAGGGAGDARAGWAEAAIAEIDAGMATIRESHADGYAGDVMPTTSAGDLETRTSCS